ncbi:MAG: hypothetical protein ACYCVH_03545 [Ignavibacteriaceae bacterium]
MESVNDIVFNFMNYLQEFGKNLEEIFQADKNEEKINLLKEFNNEYSDTFKKLMVLSNLENYKNRNLGNNLEILDSD